ncbi:MAG: isochorismatase family protein [Xanthobacteraceae bacterium]
MMTERAFVATTAVLFAALASAVVLPAPAAQAQTIIDEWASVMVPPPPELKPVTVDPKTTALLMLDFMTQNCGKRPRCVASIPAVKKLLDKARTAKVAVVYAIITDTTTADVIKDVAPLANEPWIRSGADKFINTDLEKMLKDKGIQTVIVTGTASNAAVLFTAAGAAQRGMNAIVPVDAISGIDAYADLTTAYMLASAPVISVKSTLTKIDMIKF